MPVGVVKTSRDEHLWAKAKAQAEKEGRAKDWPYVMGIFQKMSGKSMSKSQVAVLEALTKAKFTKKTWKGDHWDYEYAKDPAGVAMDVAEEARKKREAASAKYDPANDKGPFSTGGKRKFAFSEDAQPDDREEVQKALGITIEPHWRGTRWPGIPGQGGQMHAEQLFAMPRKPSPLAMLDHTEPRFSPDSVVSGLGMDMAEAGDWRNWLANNISSASNEVVARKSLYTRFIEKKTPPELRRAIFQRALNYFGNVRKAMVEVVTPDEILEKAEARGGSYYRRVQNKSGDGYRYYYNPEQYHEREDSHLDGDTALRKRLGKMLVEHVTRSGEKGCDHKPFQALASRFGTDKVAAALREATTEGGPLKFEKGTFTLRSVAPAAPESKPSLQKAQRFFIKR
jgi:hypothetical protein